MESMNCSEFAVKALIFGSAPERLIDLTELWENDQPQINFTSDSWGFKLEAGPFNLVVFNQKTMCLIWLIGYFAQKALHVYADYLVDFQETGQLFDPDNLSGDELYKQQYAEAEALLSEILKLKEAECRENFNWPRNIPEPSPIRPSDIDGAMFFDLLCMSAGWCFLHELKHVSFQSSGNSIDSHKEEFECDSYAIDFLFQKIEIYSQLSGNKIEKVKMKRSMAIALSFVLLLVVTQKQLWSGSATHPSISKRIKAFTESVLLPDNDCFWIYLSCLLVFVLKQNRVTIIPCIIGTQKRYCLQIINYLEEYLFAESK